MDPDKTSPFTKSSKPMMKGDVLPMDDADVVGQKDPGKDVLMDKEVESDPEDTPAVLSQTNHRAAADRHKFHTLGHQRKKQKAASDYASVRKRGGNVKTRAAFGAFFNQATTDKTPTAEERIQLEALRQALDAFPLPELEAGVKGLPLEDKWTDIVESHTTMNKKVRHQQEALWELIYTELSYISKLTVVTDLVLAALTFLHQRGFLLEVNHELLFSNLPLVLHAHRRLWEDVMLPMLQRVRHTKAPLDPLLLEEGCLQFRDRLSPYLDYCWEEERTMDSTRRLTETSLQFQTFLAWVESHPHCDRMRIGDMQAKPHQRITKYPLLLKAVLNNTQDAQARYSVRKMLNSVNGFVDSINDYMKLKDEELALSMLAQRLEAYEGVEGISDETDKHVRNFCRFDLNSPIRGASGRDIRKLMLEETLKIRERKEGKLEAVLLLCSDVLLVTKAQKKSEKLRVVRPPLAVDRICCAPLKDGCSFVLVEVGELGCAVTVFTVTTPSLECCNEWITTIEEAQVTLAEMRKRHSTHSFDCFTPKGLQIDPMSDEFTQDQNEQDQLDQPKDQNSGAGQLESEALVVEGTEDHTEDDSLNGSVNSVSFKINKPPFYNLKELDEDDKESNGSHNWTEGVNERRVTWNNSRTSDVSNQLNIVLDFPKDQTQIQSSQWGQKHNQNESLPSRFWLPGGESNQLEFKEDFGLDLTSNPTSRRNSDLTQSEDGDSLTESWKFSRKLKSPRLRRRRFIGSQHTSQGQVHQNTSISTRPTATQGTTSSSNSDSDSYQGLRISPSLSAEEPLSESFSTPRGVSKNEVAWYTNSSEALDFNRRTSGRSSQKKPRLKGQGREPIPNMVPQKGQDSILSPSMLNIHDSQSLQTMVDYKCHPSPLDDVLRRARERERDERNVINVTNRGVKIWVETSPSPSLSPSEGENVDIADGLPHKQTEVDREWMVNEDVRDETLFKKSVSVDWPGWCFDDEEVVLPLNQDGSPGLLEELHGMYRSLGRSKELEEDYSEV